MDPDSKIAGSGPYADENYMADDEDIEAAAAALTQAARQRFRLTAGSTDSQKRVPPTFIRYDPSLHPAPFDSVTARARIVRLSETSLDPIVPPKFRRRRLPRPGRTSPPVPVMSSPPRPPSRGDQKDWKVPPCISRWKNPNGYTIPLDKRQRASEDVRINDNFSRLAESLRAAEIKAREELWRRIVVQKEMRAKLLKRQEQELRLLAASARRAAEAAAPAAPPVCATEVPDDEMPKATKHGDSDICGAHAQEQLKKVTKTDEAPVRAAGKRERPVELSEPEHSDDPFDLDQFMAQVKKGDEH